MIFHDGSRRLQDRFDTRRLADRIVERLVKTQIDDEDKQFIESRDMFFLATVDDRGIANCSYKGGDPGFVQVVDPNTIVFPNYDGNGMYLSAGNLERHGNVGMLFMDFENPGRLRVNGTAALSFDDAMLKRYPGAQFLVRVAVREVFPNCGRYIHRMRRIERSPSVPQAGKAAPAAKWKQQPEYADVLPADDPARRNARP